MTESFWAFKRSLGEVPDDGEDDPAIKPKPSISQAFVTKRRAEMLVAERTQEKIRREQQAEKREEARALKLDEKKNNQRFGEVEHALREESGQAPEA